MQYIVRLFADQGAAERAAEALRRNRYAERDYDVWSPREATRTVKGWLEQIFGMPELLSGMEAEGLPHEDARVYEEQVQRGQTMVAVRAEQEPWQVAAILEQAGGHEIRCYRRHGRAWTQLSGREA